MSCVFCDRRARWSVTGERPGLDEAELENVTLNVCGRHVATALDCVTMRWSTVRRIA